MVNWDFNGEIYPFSICLALSANSIIFNKQKVIIKYFHCTSKSILFFVIQCLHRIFVAHVFRLFRTFVSAAWTEFCRISEPSLVHTDLNISFFLECGLSLGFFFKWSHFCFYLMLYVQIILTVFHTFTPKKIWIWVLDIGFIPTPKTHKQNHKNLGMKPKPKPIFFLFFKLFNVFSF